MNNVERACAMFDILRSATRDMEQPASRRVVEQYGKDPFLVLVSCLLSLRTKDTTSFPASQRLFEKARTPHELLQLSRAEIEKLIYPCGFYRVKARTLHAVTRDLIDRFDAQVPSTEEALLSLPGVGPKTAALVRGEGFGIPSICVDTHVHRIANRLGIIKTQNVEETEVALKKLLPSHMWIECNRLLVMWGQNICVPLSPFCSRCPVKSLCDRVGVTRSR